MIDRAILVQSEDPVAASELWSEIDRAIVDQAPYIWLLNPTDVAFVSERVGNYRRHPQRGRYSINCGSSLSPLRL